MGILEAVYFQTPYFICYLTFFFSWPLNIGSLGRLYDGGIKDAFNDVTGFGGGKGEYVEMVRKISAQLPDH